jgi:hypothetical protein
MKTNLFLLIAVIVLVILFLKQCQVAKELKINEQVAHGNLEALRDTVKIERNRAGEIEFTKQSLISKSQDLEKWNKDLAALVKKEKGKVIYIQQASGGIKTLPSEVITNTVTIYDNETSSIETVFDTIYSTDNYRRLKLLTTVKMDSSKIKSSSSKILDDQIGFNIVTGLKEEGGKIRITIRSDYPGLTFSKIDGALVDPHKSEVLKRMFPPKKFGLGPVIGYGLNPTMKPGYFIGLGLQYNIIRF